MRHRLHREIGVVVTMHHPLLDSFRAHDGEAAARCMVEHIISGGEYILKDWPVMEKEA
jgi:DNA-binding GntR family transcriptional regulator